MNIYKNGILMLTLNDLKRTDPRYSADYLRSLSKHEQEVFMWKTPKAELEFLKKDWLFWSRSDQHPPEAWGKDGCFIWIIRSGRGWGKTRTAAETFIFAVQHCGYQHPNLVGATAEDCRDLMILGESGILACAPDNFMPEYKKTEKKLVWPNGVITHIYYGSEPERGRGPQSDFLWFDELAKYHFAEDTLDNLLMGLRLGPDPRCIITSTPRPTKFLMDLEKRTDAQGRPSCVVTRGNTKDNYANLSNVFISTIISKYEGTRLGRQELDGEFLDDNPDALFKRTDIDKFRVVKPPRLTYIVVAIDPAGKSSKTSDDTGIVVVGKGEDGHGYVIGDYTIHGTPKDWATAAIAAYNTHKANKIIAESNFGGDMVKSTLDSIDPNIPFKEVHASRGKDIRAEPISSLYQQGKIHHVGFFRELEDEICEWIPNSGMRSPNRMDALVWGATDLNISTFNAPLPSNFTQGYSFNSNLSVSKYKHGF